MEYTFNHQWLIQKILLVVMILLNSSMDQTKQFREEFNHLQFKNFHLQFPYNHHLY